MYIGQTKWDVKERLKGHLQHKSTITKFIVKEMISQNDIYIDIIDTMIINYDCFHDRQKLSYCERFHMLNIIKDGKYNLLNKAIPIHFDFKYYDTHYNPNV